jgi:hypothetical protein
LAALSLTDRATATIGTKRRSAFRPNALLLLLLLALSTRVYWMISKTPVISVEGSEYVRNADHYGDGVLSERRRANRASH